MQIFWSDMYRFIMFVKPIHKFILIMFAQWKGPSYTFSQKRNLTVHIETVQLTHQAEASLLHCLQ